MKHYRLFLLLIGLLVLAFLADIAIGSVSLSIRDVWNTFIGSNDNLIYQEIILNHRLPKALTAILAGASLSVAGVLMQTLFHNPLAGPDVLGVTSGASLGVALLTLGTSSLPLWLITGWGQVTAAIIGAIGVLLLVIIVSIKIPQTISLLIIGMMFGNFAGAIVSILQSMSNPDTLKLFITWTFGSLSSVGWEQMSVMAPVIACGILTALLLQNNSTSCCWEKLRQRIRGLRSSAAALDYPGYSTPGRNLHCFYRSHSLYRHHDASRSPWLIRQPQPPHHSSSLHALWCHHTVSLRFNFPTTRNARYPTYQRGYCLVWIPYYRMDHTTEFIYQ